MLDLDGFVVGGHVLVELWSSHVGGVSEFSICGFNLRGAIASSALDVAQVGRRKSQPPCHRPQRNTRLLSARSQTLAVNDCMRPQSVTSFALNFRMLDLHVSRDSTRCLRLSTIYQ